MTERFLVGDEKRMPMVDELPDIIDRLESELTTKQAEGMRMEAAVIAGTLPNTMDALYDMERYGKLPRDSAESLVFMLEFLADEAEKPELKKSTRWRTAKQKSCAKRWMCSLVQQGRAQANNSF